MSKGARPVPAVPQWESAGVPRPECPERCSTMATPHTDRSSRNNMDVERGGGSRACGLWGLSGKKR